MIGRHVIYSPVIDEIFVIEIYADHQGVVMECREEVELDPDSFETLQWTYIGAL
jgi:hypothetical protein